MKYLIIAALVLVFIVGGHRLACGEPLTTSEKNYLRELRIGGDVDRVRVHRNTWLARHISPGIRWGTVLPGIPYHIFTISSDEYGTDYLPYLAHEYTHLVTVEKGLPVVVGKYSYGKPESLRTRHFWEFNSEQQASIVEDYARLRGLGKDTRAYRPLINELASIPDRRGNTLSGTETLVLMAARIYVISRHSQNDSIVALATK